MPPRTIPQLVDWLHQPIEAWDGIGERFKREEATRLLLVNGYPSELCVQLASRFVNTYDPHLELQDDNFRQFLEACRDIQDPEQYAEVRTFINLTPLVEDFHEQVSGNPRWRAEVRPWLNRCYEDIPRACIRRHGGELYIYLCPYCSWVLLWNRNEASCHLNGPCAFIDGNLSEKARQVPYLVGMARTTEGVQRYVVAPEITLIRIHSRLSREWGLRCSLYPQFDAYDLLIEFPNGKRWAVDVKDHRRAVELAINLNLTRFRYVPPWNRAFYIFPNYQATPGYLNEFGNYWKPEKDVDFMGARDFLTEVQKELSG
jgi:hypothetical protein